MGKRAVSLKVSEGEEVEAWRAGGVRMAQGRTSTIG